MQLDEYEVSELKPRYFMLFELPIPPKLKGNDVKHQIIIHRKCDNNKIGTDTLCYYLKKRQ